MKAPLFTQLPPVEPQPPECQKENELCQVTPVTQCDGIVNS